MRIGKIVEMSNETWANLRKSAIIESATFENLLKMAVLKERLKKTDMKTQFWQYSLLQFHTDAK